MNPEILHYIQSQRIGVLSVEMLDGSPHGATLHFAHTDEPLVFFFKTSSDYRKSQPLLGRDVSRASFVIGVDENNMQTMQLDGTVQILRPDEHANFIAVYYGKFPEKTNTTQDPKSVIFKFVPTRWQYTNWKAPQGKMVVTSK